MTARLPAGAQLGPPVTPGFPNVAQTAGAVLSGLNAPQQGRTAIIAYHNGVLFTVPEVPSSQPGADFQVRTWDITNPRAPVERQQWGVTPMPINAHGYFHSGEYLILGSNWPPGGEWSFRSSVTPRTVTRGAFRASPAPGRAAACSAPGTSTTPTGVTARCLGTPRSTAIGNSSRAGTTSASPASSATRSCSATCSSSPPTRAAPASRPTTSPTPPARCCSTCSAPAARAAISPRSGRRRRATVHRLSIQQRRQRLPRRRCHRPLRPALRHRSAAARCRVDVHPVPGRVRLHGRPQGRHAHLPVGAAPRRRQRRAPEPARPGGHRHQSVPAAARQPARHRRHRRGRGHGHLGTPGRAGYARAVGRLSHPAERPHRLPAARADLAAHPRDAGELHHRQRPDVHRPPARRRGAARSHHLLLRRRADLSAGRGAAPQHDLRGRAPGRRHQRRRRQRHRRVLLHLFHRCVGERQRAAADLGIHRLGLSRGAGGAADVDGHRGRSQQ